MTEKPIAKIEVETQLKAELKAIGGYDRDQWNERLLNLAIRAAPHGFGSPRSVHVGADYRIKRNQNDQRH